MSSSLARQLANIASIDADRLSSHHGAPSGKSYLFTPTQAAAMDLNQVHNIGLSGFEELLQLDPSMEEFEEELFSDASKSTDRMMLAKEENKRLNKTLEACLCRLSQWLGLKAGAKCFEWLVRRFRVHEMNVESCVRAFLPYHESPQFPRVLAILRLEKNSPYYYLLHPLQKAPQTVPRTLLIHYMTIAKDPSLTLLREILGMLPQAAAQKALHRSLLTFWSATTVEYVERVRQDRGGIPEAVIKVLVEGLVHALNASSSGPDYSPAIYPALLILIRSVSLASEPYSILLDSVAVDKDVNLAHRLITFMILLEHAPESSLTLGPAWSKVIKEEDEQKTAALIGGIVRKFGLDLALDRVLIWLTKSNLVDLSTLIQTLVKDADSFADSTVTSIIMSLAQSEDEGHTEEELAQARQSVLTILRQRYPEQVSHALTIANVSVNKKSRKRKVAVESNTMDWTADNSAASAFISAISANPADRAEGVKVLMTQLKQGLEGEDLVSAEETLQARLTDTDVSVLEALYSAPEELFKVISNDEYLTLVDNHLRSPFAKRETTLLHLSFLLNHKAAPADRVYQIVLPHLFYTKSRKVTVTSVWKLLAEQQKHDKAFGPLVAAHDEAEKEKAGDENAVMALSNKKLGDAVGAYISKTKDFALFEFLISILNAADEVLRYTSSISLAAVSIESIPAEYKLRLWRETLAAVRSASETEDSTMVSTFDDPELLQRIYAKPVNDKTAALVKNALLASVARSGLPISTSHIFLNAKYTSVPEIALLTSIYALTAEILLPTELASDLQTGIFAALKNDALVFLANIWSDAKMSAAVRLTALRHARAFMASHRSAGKDYTIDFQCLLPAVIFAAQSPNNEEREAALTLLTAWSEAVTESPAAVYRVDDLYDQNTNAVKLLLPRDLRAYLQAIVREASAITADRKVLKSFHTRFLGSKPDEGRKSAMTRKAIISCIISHAVTWSHPEAPLVILESLQEVNETAKLENVLGNIEEACKKALAGDMPDAAAHNIVVRLFTFVDSNTTKRFGKDGSPILDSFLAVIQATSGPYIPTLRRMVLERLRSTIYKNLSVDQQVQFCLALSEAIHSMSGEEATFAKASLQSFDLEVYGVISVIDKLADRISPESGEQQNKRVRKENSSESDETTAILTLMDFLASRSFNSLPAEPAFIEAGVRVLSAIATKTSNIDNGAIDFVEQTLLSAMSTVLEKISPSQELAAHQVGMDVIVKTIRGTTNPRTAQKALLFTSALARHSPDSVLHYVMPIFTYMGSSDFQRDDAYTFSVVEKTIQSIVPVIINSIRQRSDSSVELYIATKPLLSIFTDMAKRLPKHRTHPFFVHLVSTLGPAEFLAPTQLLLLQTSKSKSQAGASAEALRLITSISTSHGSHVAWQAIQGCLEEVRRLLAGESSFLSATSDRDASEQPTLALADAVLRMVRTNVQATAAKAADMVLLQQVIRTVVELLRTLTQDSKNKTLRTLFKSLTAILNDTLAKLSVHGFMELATDLLNARDQEVSNDQIGQNNGSAKQFLPPFPLSSVQIIDIGLTMLSERLPLMQSQVRQTISPIVRNVIATITQQLPQAQPQQVMLALRALMVISNTVISEEDGALANSVPVLLKLSGSGATEQSVPALLLLTRLT